jgi:hypothetical protein
LYLDDGVPSTHLLPFHLPEARVGDANVLARIEQIASAFEAGAGSAELGPGLLNYHLVTDEWVLATPKLWEGEGGPFGARAPQTRAEYLAVVAALNRHALSWSRSAPAPDSFAERVESKFWGPATQGPGASVHDLQHCVCKGHLGADLFLQLHLWHHALSFEVSRRRARTWPLEELTLLLPRPKRGGSTARRPWRRTSSLRTSWPGACCRRCTQPGRPAKSAKITASSCSALPVWSIVAGARRAGAGSLLLMAVPPRATVREGEAGAYSHKQVRRLCAFRGSRQGVRSGGGPPQHFGSAETRTPFPFFFPSPPPHPRPGARTSAR